MALTNDEITSLTHRFIMPVLQDNIFNSNPAMQRIKKKNYQSLAGGQKGVVPVLYATTGSAMRQTSDNLDVSSNNQISSAEFEWKRYNAAIVVSGLEEIKNAGDAAVINLVTARSQAAEKSLSDIMGTDLFAAGGTAGSFIGFQLMVDSTGTYGIIARGTNSWWAAQEDGTTAVLSLAKMQGLFGDCTVDSDRPTVIYTYQDAYDDVYGLIQPQQRYGDEETVKAGFTSILWNGIPVIVDSHVTSTSGSGEFYMLNENYFGMKYHAKRNFVLTPFQQPVNEDASYAHVKWAGFLWGNNCRMQGKFNNLT